MRKKTPGREVILEAVTRQESSPFGPIEKIVGYRQSRSYPVPKYSKKLTAAEKLEAKEKKKDKAQRLRMKRAARGKN